MANADILLFFKIITYIFMFFSSLWFGNFITSFYFRIPRGISLNGKTHPPMCSNCGVRLKYPDYGPLYYYLFRNKKCKICGIAIPHEYFWIELFTAITALTCFLIHGMNDKTCFMIFTILSLILAMIINMKHGRIPEKALWIATVAAICYTVFSVKYEPEILYTLITRTAVGFIFAGIFMKIMQEESQERPEGYIAMFAILGLIQSPIISIYLFGGVIILMGISRFIKPMQLIAKPQNFMTLTLFLSIVIVISNISFPLLELR